MAKYQFCPSTSVPQKQRLLHKKKHVKLLFIGIHSVAWPTCTKTLFNFLLRDKIQFGSAVTGGSSEGPNYLCLLSKWRQTNKCFFPQARIFLPPLLLPYTLTISTTPNYLEDSSIAPWCKNCHPTTLPFFITSFIYILGNIRWCLKIALALCKCWVERWLMARRQ